VAEFVDHLTVFVLATCVGWYVVWKVTPALHTPLMSATNAISGIIAVGAIATGGMAGASDTSRWIALAALFLAMINVVGGFWVTQRMLQMFRKKG
jgi:H+-translocating NAD(P) transhydrogenase subunit alpha